MTGTGAEEPRRIGVFGGTFDPPHVGHVSVATDVADVLDLDEVWWVPAARSPFKADVDATPGAIRLEMVRAAVAADPRFVVRDDEIRRGGVSYSVDTLRAFRAEEPGAEFFLIVGADQATRLGEWKDVEEIGRLGTVVVMDREGEAPGAVEGVPAERVAHVPVRRVDVSSTGVREAIAASAGVVPGLAPEVARVVQREALYSPVA